MLSMNQGCVNEGKDHRLFGWCTCWLQRLASFKSNLSPLVIVLELPLGFRILMPWTKGRRLMLRIALLRYDFYAKEYIFFSAALKRIAATDEAL